MRKIIALICLLLIATISGLAGTFAHPQSDLKTAIDKARGPTAVTIVFNTDSIVQIPHSAANSSSKGEVAIRTSYNFDVLLNIRPPIESAAACRVDALNATIGNNGATQVSRVIIGNTLLIAPEFTANANTPLTTKSSADVEAVYIGDHATLRAIPLIYTTSNHFVVNLGYTSA